MSEEKKKSKFITDFKTFITKGNVIDMAIGVVIGGAFSKIVASLVADIITPLLSLITGKANLSELYLCLNPDKIAEKTFSAADFPTVQAAKDAGYATLNYGVFLQTVLDFLVIALAVFCFIRIFSRVTKRLEALNKKEEKKVPEAPKAPVVTPEEETAKTLKEILEVLKKK